MVEQHVSCQSDGALRAAGFGLGRGFGSVESFPNGPVPAVPGVPAAVIPPMATGFDSAAPAIAAGGNSEGGFELTGVPMRPEAQRLRFDNAEGISYGVGSVQFFEKSGEHFAVQFEIVAANGQGSDRAATAESLTDLKPLGQVNASFIVAVNSEGLWIIDQHVAHERILFEQHLKKRGAKGR